MPRTRLVLSLVFLLAGSMPPMARAQTTREQREAILDRIYQSLEREQEGPIVAALASDVTWRMNGRRTAEIPFAGVYQGRDGVRSFLTAFFAALEIDSVGRQLVVMQGDIAVAHVELVARVPATGKALALELAQTWQFDAENRIVSFHGFHDTWSLWLAFQAGGAASVVDRRGSTDDTIRPESYDLAQIVRHAYAAFFSGDLATVLAMFGSQSVWMLKGDDQVPYVRTFVGPSGFVDFTTAMLAIAEYSAVPTIPYVVAEGNRADVYIIEPQINRVTGEESVCHIIHSYAFDDDGMLVEMKSYNDSYEIHTVFGPV